MAAIDKLYVHSYYEYDNLRRWAIAYYPELLFYFYDITTTYQQWEDNCKAYVNNQLKIAKNEYNKLLQFGDPIDKNTVIINKIKYYKEQGIELSMVNVLKEFDYTIKSYNKTAEDWERYYSCPIMNTPIKVDKKLKWICPIPCVRKYLEEHCGYKTRWYHKLFWKGNKEGFNL